MLDLNKAEKERLQIRTDINLPSNIKEALDEMGARPLQDTKIQIDFTFNKKDKVEKKKKKKSWLSFFRKSPSKTSIIKNDNIDIEDTRPHIKLIPMSVYPKKIIKKYLGLIDVHIVRHVYKLRQDDSIPKIIERILEDVNEIVKSRVEALGGNCLLGYKIDINTIEQNF